MAKCHIQNFNTIFGCFTNQWPSRISTLLTLLNFILTTTHSHTNINIYTNNSTLVHIVNLVSSTQLQNYPILDKQQHVYLLLILKALSCNRELTITMDEDIKIQETPQEVFLLDLTPQHFLCNRFVPRLLNKLAIC